MGYLAYYKKLQFIEEKLATGEIDPPGIVVDQLRCTEKTVRNIINKYRQQGG